MPRGGDYAGQQDTGEPPTGEPTSPVSPPEVTAAPSALEAAPEEAPPPEDKSEVREKADEPLLPSPEEVEEGPPPKPGMMMQALDTSQKILSGSVVRLSKSMDRMLGAREIYPEEAYDSVLRLRLIQHVEEGGNTLQADVSGRISLPGTEDRLGLIFTSEDYEDPVDRERGTERELSASEPRRKSFALRYLQPVEPWETSISAGLRTGGAGSPVDAVVRGRLWRFYQPGQWRIRPRESLFWYGERGTGESTELTLEYPLSETMLFRSETAATYFQRDEQFYYDQVFSILQPLGRKDGLLWQIGAAGQSEPNTQLVNYYAQVRFRHITYRDWLIFELTPQLLREQDENFRDEKRIFVGFELLFGGPGSY